MDAEQRAISELLIEARVRRRFGLFVEAVEALDGALGLDPENEAAHVLLVQVRTEQGEERSAIPHMLEAARLAFQRGAETEAVELWKRILDIEPQHPTARSRLGLSVDAVRRSVERQRKAASQEGTKFSVAPDAPSNADQEVFDPASEFLGDFFGGDDEDS